MSVNLHLQNLPRTATNVDIRHFFGGLDIPEGGVQIVGGPDGDAFIAFSSQNDLLQAIMRDGQKLMGQSVKLKLASRGNMEEIIERRQKDLTEAKRQRDTQMTAYHEYTQGSEPRYTQAGYNIQQPQGAYGADYERYYGQNELYQYKNNSQTYYPGPSGPDNVKTHNDFLPKDQYFQSDFYASRPQETLSPESGLMQGHISGRNFAEPRKREAVFTEEMALPHHAYLPRTNEYSIADRQAADISERVERVLRQSMDSRVPTGLSKSEMGEIDYIISPKLESQDKGDLRQFLKLIKKKSTKSSSQPPWDHKPPSNVAPPWLKGAGVDPNQPLEIPGPSEAHEGQFGNPKEDLVVRINQFCDDRVVQNIDDIETDHGNDPWKPYPRDGSSGLELPLTLSQAGRDAVESFLSLRQSERDGHRDNRMRHESNDHKHRSSVERYTESIDHRSRSQSSDFHSRNLNEHPDRESRPRRPSHERRSRSPRNKRHSYERSRSRSPGNNRSQSRGSNRHSRERSISPRYKRQSMERSRSYERSRSPKRSYERRSPSPRRRSSHSKDQSPTRSVRRGSGSVYNEPTQYASVHNVAVTVTARDLREFFRLCAIPEGGVLISSGKDDLAALVAYIKFVRTQDTEEALSLTGTMLHGRQVTVKPTTSVEFERNKPRRSRRRRSYSRSRSRSRSPSRSPSRSRSRSRTGSCHRSSHDHEYPPKMGQGYKMESSSYPPSNIPQPPISPGLWGQYPMPYSSGPMQYPAPPIFPHAPSRHFQPPPPPPLLVHSYPAYKPEIPVNSRETPREIKKAKKVKGAPRYSENIDVKLEILEQVKEQKKEELVVKEQPKEQPRKKSTDDARIKSSKSIVNSGDENRMKATDVREKTSSRNIENIVHSEDENRVKYLRMTNLPPAIQAFEILRQYEDDVPLNGVTLVRRSTGTAWFAYVEYSDINTLQKVFEMDSFREKGQRRDMEICDGLRFRNELKNGLDPGCQVLRSKGRDNDEVVMTQQISPGRRRSRKNRHKKDSKDIESDSSGFSDSMDEQEETSSSSSKNTDRLPGIVVCAKNFPLTVSEEDAEAFFVTCEPMEGLTRKTWDGHGNIIIHVRFPTLSLANKALASLNNELYHGKPIVLSFPRK